ncbi:MAG TPA: methyltransferase domain-containing protein [Tepidisphaeraceae bacterium]|nr:methyltransferase domain-containing protein [Tepidisphaeraceae bacterium]
MLPSYVKTRTGEFAIRGSSEHTPQGFVLAIQILSLEAAEKHLANIDFVLGTQTDPRLKPASVDVALVLEAYHHFNYPGPMLRHIGEGLKPGGKLYIIDFHRSIGDRHIRLDEDGVIREVEANGYRLVSKQEHSSDNQYIAVFEKR